MATVLVVEDDDVSSELVRALLERSGHDVVAAASAEEADVLLARHPAMVVVDVRLPGLDGLSLTRKLRADPATAAVPPSFTGRGRRRCSTRRCCVGSRGYIEPRTRLGAE